MNNATGTTVILKKNITSGFFNQKHNILAIYNPNIDEDGQVALYIDGELISRKNIGNNIIWTNYSTNNLSVGYSHHGIANYFTGQIINIQIKQGIINPEREVLLYKIDHNELGKVQIVSKENSPLTKIQIHVHK